MIRFPELSSITFIIVKFNGSVKFIRRVSYRVVVPLKSLLQGRGDIGPGRRVAQ